MFGRKTRTNYKISEENDMQKSSFFCAKNPGEEWKKILAAIIIH